MLAGGNNMSLAELRVAMETVRGALAGDDVNIFFGTTVKPHLGDELRVTLIASIDAEEFKEALAAEPEQEEEVAEEAPEETPDELQEESEAEPEEDAEMVEPEATEEAEAEELTEPAEAEQEIYDEEEPAQEVAEAEQEEPVDYVPSFNPACDAPA